MSKHFASRLWLTALFLLFCHTLIYTQNCNCPEYYSLKAQQAQTGTVSHSYIAALQSSPNNICKARSYEWMAQDYLAKQIFDTSELYFQKAEKIYKQSGCGDSILITTYKFWAQLYYTKSDFSKAQEYSFKLLRAAEASGNKYELAGCHTMIAQLFNQTNQAEQGIIYTRKAVALLPAIEQPAKLIDIYRKICKRYLWHYQDIKTTTSLDSSELFTIRLLDMARKNNDSNSIGFAFSNLEGIAWEKNDLKKALVFLDSFFKYADPDDYDDLGTIYYDKADILIELKNYPEAKKMADSSLHYRKLAGNTAYIAEVYDMLLAKIGEETGDYKKAYQYRELSRAITDSIKNIETTKQVAELEKKYNQATNEKKIKELAQQRRIYLLLALTGLLGLVALVFFIRQQSLKNKQKVLETEQRLNRARMNPHFFFNALSSLQAFALQENDGKALAGNLSRFSHIMRETLESTYKEYVTVEQEKDFLNEYLELQKMRFPQKFTYEITTGNTIEPGDTLIPAMILQPFVENSIEHGFTGIDYPGHIAIIFDKDSTNLHISITDNGKGLATTIRGDLSKEQVPGEHISRASQIIRDRIFLLNIKLKTRASFSVNNNTSKGVTVLIKLPLLYKQ